MAYSSTREEVPLATPSNTTQERAMRAQPFKPRTWTKHRLTITLKIKLKDLEAIPMKCSKASTTSLQPTVECLV